MKWLRSTTQNTYTVEGRIIPAFTAAPLAVSDAVYDKIISSSVIKSLIRNGCIIVMESYTDPNSAGASANTITELRAENTTLRSDLAAVKDERDRLLKDSGDIEAKNAEIAELKKQLKEQKKLYKALEAEANAKIAELSKE